jgi:hypothetical protein
VAVAESAVEVSTAVGNAVVATVEAEAEVTALLERKVTDPPDKRETVNTFAALDLRVIPTVQGPRVVSTDPEPRVESTEAAVEEAEVLHALRTLMALNLLLKVRTS